MPRTILNETSYIGAGSRSELKGEILGRGFSKAFVITDRDLVKFGVAAQVTEVLESFGFPFEVFDDVKANPTVSGVKTAIETFKASKADVLVAVGGGSVIDTAKAVGIAVANPEFSDIVSLEGVAPTKARSIPIIALPTTAGTAAEVTINYVITDEAHQKKMVCVDPKDIPVVAIVDAELMYSMPKGLTASTGMDALTHAIEGYITPGAWAMSDMFEIEAIRLIKKHLAAAVKNGKDREAREGMAFAQYVAGMGFSNVGLGIVHSMAHPLGAVYDTPHGVANAIILPTVMAYNVESPSKPKFRAIAEAMGVNTAKMNDDEAAQAAVEAVRALSKEVGIPAKLSEVGVREEDLEKLANDAFNDVCTGGNPRKTSVEDILKLYRSLM